MCLLSALDNKLIIPPPPISAPYYQKKNNIYIYIYIWGFGFLVHILVTEMEIEIIGVCASFVYCYGGRRRGESQGNCGGKFKLRVIGTEKVDGRNDSGGWVGLKKIRCQAEKARL